MISHVDFLSKKHTWTLGPSEVGDLFVQINVAEINRSLMIPGASKQIKLHVQHNTSMMNNSN